MLGVLPETQRSLAATVSQCPSEYKRETISVTTHDCKCVALRAPTWEGEVGAGETTKLQNVVDLVVL